MPLPVPLHPFEGIVPGIDPVDPHTAADRVSPRGRSMDSEALLALLDRHRYCRGSTDFFDAVMEERVEGVALALSRFPTHPLRVQVVAWLRLREAEVPELPSPTDLLLGELEERLVLQEKQIRDLSARVEQLSGLGLNSQRVNEVYAGVSVLLVGVAILGWMAAFGILPFVPEGPTPMMNATEHSKTTQGSGR